MQTGCVSWRGIRIVFEFTRVHAADAHAPRVHLSLAAWIPYFALYAYVCAGAWMAGLFADLENLDEPIAPPQKPVGVAPCTRGYEHSLTPLGRVASAAVIVGTISLRACVCAQAAAAAAAPADGGLFAGASLVPPPPPGTATPARLAQPAAPKPRSAFSSMSAPCTPQLHYLHPPPSPPGQQPSGDADSSARVHTQPELLFLCTVLVFWTCHFEELPDQRAS